MPSLLIYDHRWAEGLKFYALKAVTASTVLQNSSSYLFNYA
jgi:hypothetical protein